jgi:hypothetical protein
MSSIMREIEVIKENWKGTSGGRKHNIWKNRLWIEIIISLILEHTFRLSRDNWVIISLEKEQAHYSVLCVLQPPSQSTSHSWSIFIMAGDGGGCPTHLSSSLLQGPWKQGHVFTHLWASVQHSAQYEISIHQTYFKLMYELNPCNVFIQCLLFKASSLTSLLLMSIVMLVNCIWPHKTCFLLMCTVESWIIKCDQMIHWKTWSQLHKLSDIWLFQIQ